MAASDQYYRNQRTMDIVFAVSCILMLASIVWMFAQDYYRPYKVEQRVYRDVEVALNQQQALLNLPDADAVEEDERALDEALAVRKTKDPQVKELQEEINVLRPKKEKAEAIFQDIKSQLDSKASLYDNAVEQSPLGPESDKAKSLKETIMGLKDQLGKAAAERDNVVGELMQKQKARDAIEEPVTKALTKLKKSYEKFDALIATAAKKDWSIADSIRAAWIIDAFQTPFKIQQFTINDVPIDYNFKYVTRFDRCMTCHQGADKAAYTKDNLKALRIPEEFDKKGRDKLAVLQAKLDKAVKMLEKRKKALEGLPEAKLLPDPSKLVLTFLAKDYLTDARIAEFAAHPRLDLFVASNSKHPAEKFGCSACHSGQGSATDFYNATHSPNHAAQAKKWKQEHDWAANHNWDFPMLPARFVESSCVKCHHEVTDLITSENKNEAPKLLKGYNLVRELGCFGCHEITGIKNGKKIGPDMRLEPVPPLDKMLPEDRIKMLADPDNPPGTMAKVGPSLYRLADKTNEKWAVKWLSSPSAFRPDTKMPHFYNLSNNSPPKELKEITDGMTEKEKAAIEEYNRQAEEFNKHALHKSMKHFPAAEMHSIAHYLFKSSKEYLKNVEDAHQKTSPQELEKDEYLLNLLVTQTNLSDLLKNAASMDLDKKVKAAYGELDDKAKEKELGKANELLKAATEGNGKNGSAGLFYQRVKNLSEKDREEAKAKLLAFAKKISDQQENKLKQTFGLFDALIPLNKTAGLTKAEVADLEASPKNFLQAVKNKIAWREAPGKLNPLVENYEPDPVNGRNLFSEKGCLSCHHHDATMTADKKNKLPALPSEAHFGPDLSQVKDKLVATPGDKKAAAVWLSNWIKNPQGHSPRSTMPKVTMTDKEILDVTAWLLDQPAGKSLGSDWGHLKVETPADEEFYKLADVYLSRLVSQSFLDSLHLTIDKSRKLEFTPPAGVLNDLPEDERNLVKNYSVENVKTYLGKKAVGRLGCFACHDIPGFDEAKSIGVNLNDWGKKDPNRLSFDDIDAFVDHHYYFPDHLTVQKGDKAGKPQPFKHGADDGHNGHGGNGVKKPYEKFYFDALKHKDRIGYLNQKLLEPRSYDYNKLWSWDELSRMPKFKFARPVKHPGESAEEYAERAWKEEAEARETVMTFILGLVAEPIPTQSINQPKGDRLDEIKGRKVLEKFNCAGCHLIQPGLYEFDNTKQAQSLLTSSFGKQSGLQKDFDFPDDHVWSGKTPKSGQPTLKAFGLLQYDNAGRPVLTKDTLFLQLSAALRFEDPLNFMLDIRGKEQAQLPLQNLVYPPAKELQVLEEILSEWKSSETGNPKALPAIENRFKEAFKKFEGTYGAYGGTFAKLLPQYLADRAAFGVPPKEFGKADPDDPTKFTVEDLARSAAPPPLLNEGERVQPDWLYQFLLKPQPIRKITVLNMPQFNLSDEEAKVLVKYFAAAARLADPKNPSAESFSKIPQQTNAADSPYWKKKNDDYVKKLKDTKIGGKKTEYDQRVEELKTVWQKIEQVQKGELNKAKEQLDTIAKGLKDQGAKPEPALQEAERVWKNEVDRLTALVKNSDPKKQEEQWADSDAYIADAFRMLGSNQLCAKCHQIGTLQPAGKESEGHGPPLLMAQKRLKPGWVKHWVANPPRMLPYSKMPQYFSKGEKAHQQLFLGDSLDQVQALTDVLMILDRAMEMPINRYWTVLPPVPGKKE